MARLDQVRFQGSNKIAYQLANAEGVLVHLYDEEGQQLQERQYAGQTWVLLRLVAANITAADVPATIQQLKAAPAPEPKTAATPAPKAAPEPPKAAPEPVEPPKTAAPPKPAPSPSPPQPTTPIKSQPPKK